MSHPFLDMSSAWVLFAPTAGDDYRLSIQPSSLNVLRYYCVNEISSATTFFGSVNIGHCALRWRLISGSAVGGRLRPTPWRTDTSTTNTSTTERARDSQHTLRIPDEGGGFLQTFRINAASRAPAERKPLAEGKVKE